MKLKENLLNRKITKTTIGSPVIIIGPSQGTQGQDSPYTWGEGISSDDIDWFYGLFGEEYFEDIDTDGDWIISQDEFNTWRDNL